MSEVLDSLSSIERVQVTSQLAAQAGALAGVANPLERVRAVAKVAELIRKLTDDSEQIIQPEPRKIRNFGWDAVKLSDLSMEDLRELREQVEAEHANPRNEAGRYLENGQPSLYLYDKKGRLKLDKLARAVTYKLKEMKDAEAAEKLTSAEPFDVTKGGRSPAGGIVGMNGEFYKGGSFLPRTTLPKQGSTGQVSGAGRGFLIEPGVYEQKPKDDAKAILNSLQQFIHVDDGVASFYDRGDVAIANYVNEDAAEGRAFIKAAVDAYNAGMRWYVPGDIEPKPEHYGAPEELTAPDLEIVEHVTGKGKTLRGVIRTDLTYAQAKEIDAYTFKKDGGYFIREKHLDGYTPGDSAPAVKPELTPEQVAQSEADRAANDQLRQQQKRTEQVSKLRAAAQSTIDKAEEDLGRDRNTNTARRARMASSINERNEQARAIGKTMMNLAGAIESGEAKALAGVTSKAAVETLHNALVSAMYEADKGLTYQQQLQRKGRKAEPEDVRFAKFPSTSWDSASTSRAKVLEAIKGKRGAPALADKVRYAVGPDSETIHKLQDMVGKKEADSLLGWYNVEIAARVSRLERAGITNTDELKAALLEYLQFREGVRAEDPIKAAERAIIGQKVGIDFFPTPTGEAQRMVQMADIKSGDLVLEPSAGNGNIADAAAAAGAKVDVLEISSQLRDILKAKGYNIVGHDFMEYSPGPIYDAVVMNPPFSDRLDALHIMRAFDMLKVGGRLVAIAGEGVFFGSDKKAVAFRDWLEGHSAEVEQLPAGTFTDNKLLARTSANARVLVMQKG